MKHDAIAVIDFGGQYAHLIATKVRRQGVLAEILKPEDPIETFAHYRGIIISGSPSLASLGGLPCWMRPCNIEIDPHAGAVSSNREDL